MNDNDLRALAAKLLKHYVAEDEAVAKIVETKTLERGEPKVVPLITAEERNLLNMLGGPMAGAMECRVVSLAAQGCGCGCGCGCGDGDDDGEAADSAAAASAASAASAATGDPSASTSGLSAGQADSWGGFSAASAADAAAAAAGPGAGLGNGPGAGDMTGSFTGDPNAGPGQGPGFGPDSAIDMTGVGNYGPGQGQGPGYGEEGFDPAANYSYDPSLSAAQNAMAMGDMNLAAALSQSDHSSVAEFASPSTSQSASTASPDEKTNDPNAGNYVATYNEPTDPGVSAATYGALANQNAQVNATLDAVNAGLDTNLSSDGANEGANIGYAAPAASYGLGPAQTGQFSLSGPQGVATSQPGPTTDQPGAATNQVSISNISEMSPAIAAALAANANTNAPSSPEAAPASSFGLAGLGAALSNALSIGGAQAGELGWTGWVGAQPYGSYPSYIQAPQTVPNAPVATADQLQTNSNLIGPTVAGEVGFNAYSPTSIANQQVSLTAPGWYYPDTFAGPTATTVEQVAAANAQAERDAAQAQAAFDLPSTGQVATQQVGTSSVAPSTGLSGNMYTGQAPQPAAPETVAQTSTSPVAAAPPITISTVPGSWAAGTPGAAATDYTGQFTTSGPRGSATAVDPYAGTTPVGPGSISVVPGAASNAAPAMSSPTAAAPTYTGISAIDDRINSALDSPGTTATNLAVGFIPGVGLVNTVSGLLGGPTIGGIAAGLVSGSKAGVGTSSTPLPNTDGGGGDVTSTSTGAAQDGATTGAAQDGATTGGGAVQPPTVLPAQDAILRKYLGVGSNLYRYGMGPERKYYSADGGYFDADQYFADGGLVQPLSPPTTPLVSAQPTMAFTDGVGAVGSIAQPPGMYQSDAYGSEAPHASPMAPSVAAAVPSFQPGLATLATPNVNASPTPSPIAQNPNVGYANGSSPLSNLTRS